MRSPTSQGALAGAVRRVAGASARHPKTTILLWLLFVLGLAAAGTMTGTRMLTDAESGVGPSQRAQERMEQAGLEEPGLEHVLLRSADAARTREAAADLTARLGLVREVADVRGPAVAPGLSAQGGRAALVQVALRGDPDDAGDNVAPIERAVAAVAADHPGTTLRQAGDGTFANAFDGVLEEDLRSAEVISLPLTLLILLLAFGALVAASVPLLLGVTSVAGALGALGLVSQVLPDGGTSASLVVLIGLAVGVDYSLFYIRREREERRRGLGPHAALDAAAATVGRAVLVSGITVVVAIAGFLLTGLAVFVSMGLATMIVVAISVVGSLTVLPAVLMLLGDRVDRGRIPLVGRLLLRRAGRTDGLWGRFAGTVTRHPRAALVTAVCVLGTIAVPASALKVADPGASSLPGDLPVTTAHAAIEKTFPGAPSDVELVVDGTASGAELEALGERARRITRGQGAVDVARSADGSTAVVSVPMPEEGAGAAGTIVAALRAELGPEVLVGGRAARAADFTRRLDDRTPVVIAFVLGLAFVVLVLAFRSPALAATVIGLNLLSVGAAYGVLVAVFQGEWAEGLLDFTSNGTIVDWVPLFAFVILFGLSMDYTVMVLERIREGRAAGLPPRAAAAQGVAATGGAITSAAVIMVAVFSVFASLRMIEMKQMGVGLAAAVLIDATIVRAVALPAAVTLLGERGWRVPERRRATWEDGTQPRPVEARS